MRLRRWHLVACAAGGALAALGIQWIVDSSSDRYGPFDRYVVEAVVRNSTNGAYAAIVTYHHANSSTGHHAIWLGEGEPPSSGSTAALPGRPALISVASINADQITFGPDHRLIVTISKTAEVLGSIQPCYFDDVGPNAICLDSSMIRVKVVASE